MPRRYRTNNRPHKTSSTSHTSQSTSSPVNRSLPQTITWLSFSPNDQNQVDTIAVRRRFETLNDQSLRYEAFHDQCLGLQLYANLKSNPWIYDQGVRFSNITCKVTHNSETRIIQLSMELDQCLSSSQVQAAASDQAFEAEVDKRIAAAHHGEYWTSLRKLYVTARIIPATLSTNYTTSNDLPIKWEDCKGSYMLHGSMSSLMCKAGHQAQFKTFVPQINQIMPFAIRSLPPFTTVFGLPKLIIMTTYEDELRIAIKYSQPCPSLHVEFVSQVQQTLGAYLGVARQLHFDKHYPGGRTSPQAVAFGRKVEELMREMIAC